MQRLLQAHTYQMADYVDVCVDHLLAQGVQDWSPCYEDLDLRRRVHERALKFLMKHPTQPMQMHKGGKLNPGHQLSCEKCNTAYAQGWQCKSCRYNAWPQAWELCTIPTALEVSQPPSVHLAGTARCLHGQSTFRM